MIPEERESWLSSVSPEGVTGFTGKTRGTERILVNDVNRGRIYENVEDGGGGAGGGLGGLGGGNQLCKDNRARSEVTWRCR